MCPSSVPTRRPAPRFTTPCSHPWAAGVSWPSGRSSATEWATSPTSGSARESHLAFAAADRAAVNAFFDAAVALGAEVLHEPRLWPEYHPAYYGAFVRDPDGNNVEAVCHTAA